MGDNHRAERRGPAGSPASATGAAIPRLSRSAGTLDRAKLWAVQTPQVFRRGALERGLGDDELVARATDDAWLIEQQGGTVRVIDSGEPNLKITTPHDLRVAELLLSAGTGWHPGER